MKTKLIMSILAFAALASLTGCNAFAPKVPLTKINIDPVTHEVSMSNPKDTIITNFKATIATNGTSTVSWDNLSTVMNPTNIQAAGNAEASIVTATGDAVVKALTSAGAAAGTALGAAAKAP